MKKGIVLTRKAFATLNNPDELVKMPLNAQKVLMGLYISAVSPELLDTTLERMKYASQPELLAIWNEYFERLVLDNGELWDSLEGK